MAAEEALGLEEVAESEIGFNAGEAEERAPEPLYRTTGPQRRHTMPNPEINELSLTPGKRRSLD